MALYRYQAVKRSGETVTGEIDAPSREGLVEHLHRQGYLPVSAEKKTGNMLDKLASPDLFQSRTLSTADIAHLVRELAAMLHAGLPAERALDLLSKGADKRGVRSFIESVLARIRKGTSLADALQSEKATLPKAVIGMVRAGEAGGGKVLVATLERLADHLSKDQAARESISSALIYPMIVLAVAALSIILMLLFVLPRFEPLFESAQARLPLSTQIVLSVGHVLRDYGLLFILLAVGAAFSLRRLLQRDDVRLWRDARILALPKIGPVIAKAEAARFCRTLGVLQASGVPLATAMTIAAEGLGNSVLAGVMDKAVIRVREGESLSAALSGHEIMPPLALQMIRIGEETGQLDAMLVRIADIYDRDVQRFIELVMKLVTPVSILVLGAIVAGIIGSVLSAILSVNDLIT